MKDILLLVGVSDRELLVAIFWLFVISLLLK